MEQKPFIVRFQSGFIDTDAGQVVHFSNYLKYFERVEEEFYRRIGLGGFSYFPRNNYGLPRSFASCRYKSPLRLDDEIEVQLTIEHLGKVEIEYRILIYNLTTNRTSAEGSMTAVWLDMKKWKPISIPDEVRKLLTSFMDGTLTLT